MNQESSLYALLAPFFVLCLCPDMQAQITPTVSQSPTASSLVFGQNLGNSVLSGGSVASGGLVTTLAGSGQAGFADGSGSVAQFNAPTGVAVDSSGTLYVADESNHRIRKITTEGAVTTLAGDGYWGSTDGSGPTARFKYPSALALDNSGNIYVADSINNRIRKITSSGVVTTLAGNGEGGLGDSSSGSTNVKFWQPNGVAVDSGGNVYVGDSYNNRLRCISRYGYVMTLAGSGASGQYSPIKFADGNGSVAKFWSPQGVAVDSSDNVYIADKSNHRIRKYKSGVVSTLAGSGEPGFTDGTGAAAQFGRPEGVAVDAAGNVYVAEYCRIRKVTPSGVVTTLAGGDVGFRDGLGTNALFDQPAGVAVDSLGNLYVADTNNNRIRKITFFVPGSWTWASPASIPNAGTSLMDVIFTPADPANYNQVTKSVSVTVAKASTLIISSPAASSIYYGQALSSSTLSGGLASVAGTFTWSDPSTILSQGISTQNVIFSPTDSSNYKPSSTFVSVTVNPAQPPPVVSSAATASGKIGTAFSYQITATGGATSYSATGLPAGLTVNTATGLISGKPTKVGRFSVTLQALKKGARTATATAVFTVVQVPTFTYAPTINAGKGKALKVSPTIAGYPAPTFSILTGRLPPGLSLNRTTAAITGTPTTLGKYPFTVRGSNSVRNTDRSVTIVVK